MKKWNFRVKSNVQETINKLTAEFGSVDGFMFSVDHNKTDAVTFKLRKRSLYAFQIMGVNKIIVNGKILKTGSKNDTTIEAHFTQYFLMKLIIFVNMFTVLGFLIAIISKISSSPLMYIAGGILLIIGIIIWIIFQKKFEKDIQEYKTLLSDILEP